ncbi:protein LEKR1 isoform X2 [Brienomyrus brachyistius]|uniref:protein LEKR1 isoform X2 n=2 Tax=Brienomyrus brachyistius TaxID=42636 RepID=UPI0020B1A525|nr:protein LEKR1 isoform X2 [Brienomyrus brachyistius]
MGDPSREGEEYERYSPIYPLPLEIQQMDPTETVCKYCGVSYLILHEFRRLKERLCVVEHELDQHRGSAEREGVLRNQLEELTSVQHQQVIRLQELGQQLESVSAESSRLEQELDLAHESCRRFRVRSRLQKKALESALSLLRLSHQQMQDVSLSFLQFKGFWKDRSVWLLQNSHCAQAKLERQTKAVDQGVVEVCRFRGQVEELQTQLQAQAVKQNQHQEARAQLEELKMELSGLQRDLSGSRSECQRLERLLESQAKEIEEQLSRQVQVEKEQSATHSRLSQELKEKEDSWLSCQQRCRSLQEQLCVRGRREDGLAQKHLQMEADNRALRNTLQQTQKEITLLKKQSKEAALVHQENMANLEQTLKLKIAEGEAITAEMEATLQRERFQVALQSRQQEEELRRELRAEKDKGQEMLLASQRENIRLQRKLSSLVEEAMRELQEQVGELQERLQEAEATIDNSEQRRREEVEEESARCYDLERELQHVRGNEQQGVLQMSKMKQELEEQRKEMSVLQEENVLLQETVRQECEEREELTAALSQAQEQLVELRRTAPPLSPGTPSAGPRITGPRLPPTLPRISSKRSTSVSGTRHRVSLTMGRKERA